MTDGTPKLARFLMDKIAIMRERMEEVEVLELLAFSSNPEMVGEFEFVFHDQRCSLEIRRFEYVEDNQVVFVDKYYMENPVQLIAGIGMKFGPEAQNDFHEQWVRDQVRGDFRLD